MKFEVKTVLINPYKQFSGSWIPTWLLERTEISAKAKLIYSRLAQFAGDKGYCFPGRENLAKKTGLSVRQVERSIIELVESGLIIKKQRGLNKTNIYYFQYSEWMNINEVDLPKLATQNSIGSAT